MGGRGGEGREGQGRAGRRRRRRSRCGGSWGGGRRRTGCVRGAVTASFRRAGGREGGRRLRGVPGGVCGRLSGRVSAGVRYGALEGVSSPGSFLPSSRAGVESRSLPLWAMFVSPLKEGKALPGGRRRAWKEYGERSVGSSEVDAGFW